MKIVWTKRASKDLRAVREYIARDDPRAATTTALRILESIEQLSEFPAVGRAGRVPNTRELIVSGTPFIIPYRIEADIVEILAVMHSSRQWSDIG